MKTMTALVALTLLAAPAFAEDGKMHDHGMSEMKSSADSEASKAFMQAHEKMMKEMPMKMTGDPDVDFVTGMIPHHQGAIDMAQVELKYGKNEETRKLAQDIIKAQEAEIAQMKEWLAKHKKN
jgi:uncharacterized protein (DUF305 family)